MTEPNDVNESQPACAEVPAGGVESTLTEEDLKANQDPK